MGTDSVRMYSVCTGPSPGGGRVLQREPGRRLDGRAVPEESAERAGHGQAQDPRHVAQRLAEDAIPGVGPQQFRRAPASARRHRPAASPACGIPDSSADSSTLLPVTVRSRQGAPTPKPTEHCAPVTSPGSVTEMSACWIRLFQDGAMTFQKNTDGARRVVAGGFGESLVGAGATRVEDTGDGVADLEDMGAETEVLVGIADLGHPEPLPHPPTASGTARVRRRASPT